MKSSPTLSVPLCTSTVATGPLPASSCASTTVPVARLFGFALRSSSSACSRICSSSSSTFVPFFAEISVLRRRAAELLEHDAVLQQILLDLHRVRLRQVDLVDRDDHRHAGVLGVRDRFDRLRHDGVVGRHDEDRRSSVTCAPRARMAVNASWPGVSRKVIILPPGSCDVVRADVLRDAAGLAGDDVRLADVVEQRRLAVVDVAHDRDDRRTRHEILRRRPRRPRRLPRPGTRPRARPGSRTRRRSSSIWSKSRRWLIGDHQAEVLEREADDLRRRAP